MFQRATRFCFVFIVLSLFIIVNLLFCKYIVSVKTVIQSGEEYIERKEYTFSPEFSDGSDYVTQNFYPQERYLKSIKIRLGVGYAGLEDKFVLRIELNKNGEVFYTEDVVLYDDNNWRYHELQVEQYVTPHAEYSISIRQIEGPRIEQNTNQYKFSYTAFIAAEHVEENATQYYFNGEVLNGELDTCYVYETFDYGHLIIWIGTNLGVIIILVMGLLGRNKIPLKIKCYVARIMWGGFPIIVYILCEYILGNLFSIEMKNHIINIIIYYAVYAVILLVVSNLGIIFLLYSSIMVVLTLAQYFVTLFRGRPLYVHDILAVHTAAAVASNYNFQINNKIFVSVELCLLMACIGAMLRQIYTISWRKKIYGACGVVAVVMIMFMTKSQWLLSVNMWDVSSTYQKGGNVLTLLSQMPYTFVSAPDGYSVNSVEELSEIYVEKENTADIIPKNIILIMNETFADLEYIEKIQTETELLPYWKSLEKNTIRGYLHVPVFGAGTANSEYEVLTGNSMEFLAQGSTAYQMNVSDKEFSIVSILEEQGYLPTAMHPFEAENWNRTNVYNYMGFDDFYASSNWGGWEEIRWCASDRSAYEKVINIEKESDENQFIFLVTMQNHGGYAEEWDNFSNEVVLDYEHKYPEAEQYLSLLQESDRAFHEFLKYYESSDETTMIIMFGDHQAAIEDEFYEELYGKKLVDLNFEEKQSRYVTPFVIWANYDIEEQVNVEISANYFGSYILEKAGVELSAYNYFLLDIMEEIPVIGIGGIKTNEGKWYKWNELLEEHAALINSYRILEYNNVFDRANRVGEVFTIKDNICEE